MRGGRRCAGTGRVSPGNTPDRPETLTASPPTPLRDITRPARREVVHRHATSDGPLEAVEIRRERGLRHPEGLIGSTDITRERAEEHQRAHAVRMARGQHHGRKRRLRHREDRHAFAPHRVEHRDHSVGPGLHRRAVVDRHCVGAARAEEVGQDQAAERRQAPKVAGDGGLVPQQVDRERRGGNEEEVGAIPDDLVRNVGVTVFRVKRLGSARHAVSIAR